MDLVIVVGIVVIIFAYALQGITGFGKSLVATPILSLFIPVNEVIAIVILSSIFANTYMLIRTIKYSNFKQIWVMIIMGVIGILIGVQLLSIAPVTQLKIGMGIIVILSAIMLGTKIKLKIKENHLSYGIAGFSSGLFSGLLSMGGPPVVFFLQNQQHEKHEFRGNLTLFFFFTSTFAIASLFFNQMVTPAVISMAIYLIPASLIGALLGNYLSHKVDEKVFKKIVLFILIVSGISAIVSSFI